MKELKNNEMKIERVSRNNYDDFCRMIVWRTTGDEEGDITRFKQPNIEEFFSKYNVLDSDTFFIFAARHSGRFVGWITASLIPKPDPRLGTLYIDELWVADAYRNKGIAAELMKEAVNIAKEMKLWKVRLYVNDDNDTARAFYKKMGFIEKGTCKLCELHIMT